MVILIKKYSLEVQQLIDLFHRITGFSEINRYLAVQFLIQQAFGRAVLFNVAQLDTQQPYTLDTVCTLPGSVQFDKGKNGDRVM